MLASSRITLDGKVVVEVARQRRRLVVTSLPRPVRSKTVVHPAHCFPTFHLREGLSPGEQRTAERMSTKAFQYLYGWNLIFSGVTPILPVRSALPRLAILGRSTGQPVGSGGEETLKRLASDARIGPEGRTLEWLVNHWVSSRLAMLNRIHLDRIDTARTIVSLRGDELGGWKDINLASMGKGFSQVLPILTGVLGSGYDDCVLIEQPELHLHPKLQAGLGDLFVNQLTSGWVNQFIIETHSEHLLLRIRRRVAEGMIDPARVGVLVVERHGQNTTVTPLSLKADGYFDSWPKGFFEEGVSEAYAIASARKRTSGDTAGY